MMIVKYFLPVLFFSVNIPQPSSSDRASTWEYCECYWGEWESWSECNSLCFGRKERSRWAWWTEHPGCDEFNDCGTDDEGWDYSDCNNVCHNGGTASGNDWTPCRCVAGYYGQCCSDRVKCGAPSSIAHGSVSYSDTYYGYSATYSCDQQYNLTGYAVRTCYLNFAWSGRTPTCIFANHCKSSPCRNAAVCVDLLGDYRCNCQTGWSGRNCENDIQPPVMQGCPRHVYVNATDTTVFVNWTQPTFTDPMGNTIDVTKNYQNPEFKFPWGDFTVQYMATKLNNGLQTECIFNIRVRPTPCKDLNVPTNGARVCNGWKTDYGRFCLLTCSQNYTISPTYSYKTWYVCGASGQWIAPSPMPDCEIEVDIVEDALHYHPEYLTYTFTSCNDLDTKRTLQNMYIEQMKEKDNFADFCSRFPDECRPDRVDVQC